MANTMRFSVRRVSAKWTLWRRRDVIVILTKFIQLSNVCMFNFDLFVF